MLYGVGVGMEKPTERDLDRYIKVKKLATQSPNEGERYSAKRTLEKWDKRWQAMGVNIAKEAEIWDQLTQGQNANSDEPPHWGDVYKQQQAQRETEWKQKFSQWGQAASSAFSWAANMASQAFAMQEARLLALEEMYTKIQVRTNPTGSMSINIRIAPEAVKFTKQLSEEQKILYANLVAERVAEDLLEHL